jgi:hypothetical protein
MNIRVYSWKDKDACLEVFKSNCPKYFDQALIYNDFINNYKEEITFIYKQMKEFLLKKVDDLDNKYIKSLFKKICITYNIKDSVTIKHMAEEYKKVYGWITMNDIKKLLNNFFVIKKVKGVISVIGIILL